MNTQTLNDNIYLLNNNVNTLNNNAKTLNNATLDMPYWSTCYDAVVIGYNLHAIWWQETRLWV